MQFHCSSQHCGSSQCHCHQCHSEPFVALAVLSESSLCYAMPSLCLASPSRSRATHCFSFAILFFAMPLKSMPLPCAACPCASLPLLGDSNLRHTLALPILAFPCLCCSVQVCAIPSRPKSTRCPCCAVCAHAYLCHSFSIQRRCFFFFLSRSAPYRMNVYV